jgi:hypothetical protein
MTGAPTSGPLGRDSLSYTDKMLKYKGEVLRNIDAAETLCGEMCIKSPGNCERHECPWFSTWFTSIPCSLFMIRNNMHPEHDDPEPTRPIGTCPDGEICGSSTICRSGDRCEFQRFERDHTHLDPIMCGREAAALALAEQEQRKTAVVEGLLIWDDGTHNRPEVVSVQLRETAAPIHDMVLEQALGSIWREYGAVPVRVTVEILSAEAGK